MGNCKDCEFWDRSWIQKDGAAVCFRVTANQSWNENRDYSIAPDDAVINYGVSDDSGLWIDLLVGPEFGCVMFEQRKEK